MGSAIETPCCTAALRFPQLAAELGGVRKELAALQKRFAKLQEQVRSLMQARSVRVAPAEPPVAKPKLLTRAEAAEREGVAPCTVWNWITRGVLIRGEEIRLQAERVGAYYRIRPEALDRFRRECQEARRYRRPLPPTSRQDRKALERAEASLDRRGCK